MVMWKMKWRRTRYGDDDVEKEEGDHDDVEDDDEKDDNVAEDKVEEDDVAEDEVEDDEVEDDCRKKGKEDDDVENDDVEEEEADDDATALNGNLQEKCRQDRLRPERGQFYTHTHTHFVRACAVETHVKISQEPLYTEICQAPD